MGTAQAHDGSELYFEVYGSGPAVLLYNADPKPPDHPLRQHVLDFTNTLVSGLADRYRVVAMSYPGSPKPNTFTPAAVTADVLAIADAAEVDRFAWWGYSFGGVVGLQLALRTDRLTALAMTGFPPISGPYEEMLRYSRALASVDQDALGASIPEEARAQLPQYATYYEHLQAFDDRAAQAELTLPRLCWVGGADEITAGPEKITHIGETVARHQRELEELGWEVEVLTGKDHLGAMAADVVLPRLSGFLDRRLLSRAR
ncbi:alpha/beta hydrolase [Saccharothrix xinjiangensis]|uniref:Alpha/beta fold hydrolase n=1 Tax=Saccharothrix xinjiangensis TaxID=204798 RepID=A0ABV9XTI0_9PSEU